MKKLIAMLLAAGMCVSMAACGGGSASTTAAPAAAEKKEEAAAPADDTVYEFSFATSNTDEMIDTICAKNIVDRMDKETGGKVKLKLYPAGQLGDLTQIYDEVIAGTIDMSLTSVYGTYNILNEATYLPFLAADYDDYRKVFDQNGFLFNSVAEKEKELGVTQLGYFPGGFIGLCYTDVKGTTPEQFFDPTAKKNGLIRIPAMEYVTILMKAMNFNVTYMNYSAVYTALQTGTIDGSWHSGPYLNYESFRDVMKYYVDYKAANDNLTCMMNTEKFESMPVEYQELLTKVVKEELNKGIADVEKQEEECIQKMRDYGIEVYEPTPEQRAAMKEWVIENVWPSYYEMYGEEFMKGLIASLEG